MSWVKDNCVSFFQYVGIKILKTGRIPQHVAIIMDGNRRYARKIDTDTRAGHYKGFDKLSEALKWCLELGISEMTVYAFSIENFKRSKEEVDNLMILAREKCIKFLEDIDEMNEMGIRLNFVGRLSLLPEDLQVLASKAMMASKNNKKLRLNFAYAYTGRDDISRAASHIVDGVNNNELSPDEINEDLITQVLDVGEPELLVRTSGEVRLSDFMLWQVSNTVLYFADVLWPEISIWSFFAAIMHFRKYAPFIEAKKENSPNQEEFLNNLKTRKWMEIEKFASFSVL